MSEILSIISQDRPSTVPATRQLGARGESLAVDYLTKQGYRIAVTNFTAPIGRNSRGVSVTGEIDIIAVDGETICFVEVKTRRSDEFAPLIASVNLRKQRQIIRTARVYRRIFNLSGVPNRFDVVTVLIPGHAAASIDLIKGLFSEAKFRKRSWNEPAGFGVP
ncbi:MAG: YraN family protein [Pyrinomonadaceae bacterium]